MAVLMRFLCAVVAAAIGSSASVVTLDSHNMQKVHMSSELWIVLYCEKEASACGSPPEHVEAAAKKLSPYNINFGIVDCSKDMAICQTSGIRRLPSVQYFSAPPEANPYSNKPFRKGKNYSGQPNTKNLSKLASSKMPNYVELVATMEELETAKTTAANAGVNVAVVVSSKPKKVSPLIKMLAIEFHQRLQFVQVSDDDLDILGLLDVSEAPALVVLGKDGPSPFEGTLSKSTAPDAITFLAAFATDKVVEFTLAGVVLTEANFAAKVEGKSDAWMVAFTDGSQSSSFKKAQVAAGEVADAAGLVSVGTVDCKAQANLCKAQGIDEFPAALSYGYGIADAKKVRRHGKSPSKAVAEALDSVPDKTIPVYEAMMDQHLVGNMQSKKLTVLYMTASDENEIPAWLKSISNLFHHDLSFGVVQSPSDAFLTRFNMKDQPMPLLVALITIQDPEQPEGKVNFQMAPFQGKHAMPEASIFAKTLRDNVIPQMYPEKERQETPEMASSFSSSKKDLTELTAANQGDVCQKKLCVVAFVNGLETDEQVAAQIAILKKVHQRKHSKFDFYWVNAGCQRGFSDSFGIDEYGMPGAAVWSKSKGEHGMYIRMRGSYTEESISTFLQGVRRQSHAPTVFGQAPPALIAAGDCAVQGAPAENLEEDDAIDMSEFLAEIAAEEAEKEAALNAAVEDEGEDLSHIDQAWLKRLADMNKKPKKKSKKKKKKKKKKKGKKGKKSEL